MTVPATKDIEVIAPVEFEPVEFWNALFPNEEIRIPTGKDRAADKIVKFFAGRFTATEQWQVDAIEKHAKHAKRADSPTEFITEGGWTTRNSEIFKEYSQRYG